MSYVRLRPEDRRSRLLELGVRLFSERPYDEFSMDELAATAGVSKGLLYHYFPSKRDFYIASLRSSVEEMLRLIDADRDLPPDEQLREGLRAYLDYVEGHAAPYQAVLRGGIGSDPDVAAVAEGFRRAIAERVFDVFGEADPDATLRIAVAGWIGLVEGASLEWIQLGRPPRERVVDLLVVALQGLVGLAGNAEAGALAPS